MIGELVVVVLSAIFLIHIIAMIIYACRKQDIDAWFENKFGKLQSVDQDSLDKTKP